jgi:High potential iron-sulfur protein
MKELTRGDSKISRRHVLLRTVCAAGAVTIIHTEVKASKMPQTSPVVLYQSSPKGSQQCDNCLLFQAPASCQVVDGVVSPTGWCKLWAKKASQQ